MANLDTVMSDSDVRIVDKTELDSIKKELQGAVSSAAFMGATRVQRRERMRLTQPSEVWYHPGTIMSETSQSKRFL